MNKKFSNIIGNLVKSTDFDGNFPKVSNLPSTYLCEFLELDGNKTCSVNVRVFVCLISFGIVSKQYRVELVLKFRKENGHNSCSKGSSTIQSSPTPIYGHVTMRQISRIHIWSPFPSTHIPFSINRYNFNPFIHISNHKYLSVHPSIVCLHYIHL